MKLSNPSSVPVYTISGASTARPLPEWLIRKRKRSLKKDPEFANRIELLQDFEFEEASACVKASEDGDWVVSTGTYKPQMHVHYLPHLSLSYARHTDALNQTFLLLSSDYSKSLHLQSDRSLEFHNPQGRHYTARIPRYGRDLKYNRRTAEALVPAVGVDTDGFGEVYRLNLEVGRFMKSYEIDVGGDDLTSAGAGALQGGINTGSVNTAAVAEESHNLEAFGTSIGTVEFWDPRSRGRVGLLPLPKTSASFTDSRTEITCTEFHSAGLTLAAGTSEGLIYLYDLRSPVPLLKKDQGYGFPIQTITFLTPSKSTSANAHLASDPKILSGDKRIIKIWDQRDGQPWTSVEPVADLHCVEWCKDSGMLLTANEGRQQHSFFIPQLGPAPKWCSFMDNLVEEMAEDYAEQNGLTGGHKAGQVYDNYKFVAMPELRALNLDHLVGTTNLLRPYMHGYFVAQHLYEEARLISQPELWEERRQKTIREKIEKERESRIRGNKKISVKVNRRLAERMLEREDKNERRKAKRALEKGLASKENIPNGHLDDQRSERDEEDGDVRMEENKGLLADSRFSKLFEDEDFAVDEMSHEFRSLNPSTVPIKDDVDPSRRLTAVELEDLEERRRNSSTDDDSDDSDDSSVGGPNRSRRAGPRTNGGDEEDRSSKKISSSSYRKAGHVRKDQLPRKGPQMRVSSSTAKDDGFRRRAEQTFGSRAAETRGQGDRRNENGGARSTVVGEKEITFAPSSSKQKQPQQQRQAERHGQDSFAQQRKNRRSASNNTFRNL